MDKIKNFFQNKRNLIITSGAVFGIITLISILVFAGILDWPKIKNFFTRETEIEPDANLMNSRNAYDIALLKAREWKPDAVLTRVSSVAGETGPNGRSDDWDLLFISKNFKGRGYHIIINNREISIAEEILYVGFGEELPENIISSKEAVQRARQIKGYENEEVISVEVIYGPDGSQWYWGVKTSKGVITINARQ